MSWPHEIVKALNERDTTSGWLLGSVTSPEREVDPETGAVTYIGPLIISCIGGEIQLEQDRLVLLEHYDTLYAGLRVALVGNPFGGAPGAQKLLVAGVIL